MAAALYLIPSNEYILLPDRARPLAPYVTVKGERSDRDGGGIYYVAVEVKKASILEKLFPGLHEGATLVPASRSVVPGESEKQHRNEELQAMALSQQIGAAVALEPLGYRSTIKSPGTVIAASNPNGPAAGKLRRERHRSSTVDGKPCPRSPTCAGRSEAQPGRPRRTDRAPGKGATRKVEIKTIPDKKTRRGRSSAS